VLKGDPLWVTTLLVTLAAALTCHQVPANVAEARQWIANWRAKSTGGKATSSSSSSSASSSKPAAAAGSSDVPPNVLEARQWIANWRAKSSGSGGSSGGSSSNGTGAAESDVQVTNMENPFAKLFNWGKSE
jgi:Meckel syndrome type 1 protein